jgi:hypothetical protein
VLSRCVVTIVAALALFVASCGDGSSDNGVSTVFVAGGESAGTHCPKGTTKAYQEGSVLVCDSCATDADCSDGHPCLAVCGPGCEHDTVGGCCPVRECFPLPVSAEHLK